MSRLDDLIAGLCPNGVEQRPLGEVGEFVRGSGLHKKDFVPAGAPCIHYGQIYTHYGTVAQETISYVSRELASQLRKAHPGDLIVTTTSENLNDVCKAVAWLGEVEVVIGGHSCAYRHSLDPRFAAYLFQAAEFDRQKRRLAKGTKVKEVSGKDLARITVPVPPLAVQREVADVLQRMETLAGGLEAELRAELQARRLQYVYHRDALLAFEIAERGRVRWLTLGEVGPAFGGLTGKTKADFGVGDARFVPYVQVFAEPAIGAPPSDRVRIGASERQRTLEYGDLLFTASSESANDVGMSAVVDFVPAEPVYLNSFCFGVRPAAGLLEPRFAKHLFRSSGLRRKIARTANGVTRFNISKARFAQIEIPVPPIDEQRRIAGILDRFDALVNDLTDELPAELAARRRQYEYYRDRLLTFPPVAATAD